MTNEYYGVKTVSNQDQKDFETKLTQYRNAIQNIDKEILELKKHDIFKKLPKEADQGEMLANIMLTYRHLEDAIMRIGKIFQALDGGKSVYNR